MRQIDGRRLLSAAGIPKLRRISKDRLKFKGKGHEVRQKVAISLTGLANLAHYKFSDVARLLNTYQLWLDDLYPRAKFADGLAIIEKLGHSKRIQMMRKEWIEEGKPKAAEEIDQGNNHNEDTGRSEVNAEQNIPVERTTVETDSETSVPDDAAITIEEPTNNGARASPDGDEIDALLAEESALEPLDNNLLISGIAIASRPSKPTAVQDDEFADDMEAMAEMDGLW